MRLGQHRHLSRSRLDAASREVELSRERLDAARREVIVPLRELSAQNSFAEIIRASVIRGYGRKEL